MITIVGSVSPFVRKVPAHPSLARLLPFEVRQVRTLHGHRSSRRMTMSVDSP